MMIIWCPLSSGQFSPRILDEDYNLVIAPVMQRRGQKLVEVKHGDLAPGKAPGMGIFHNIWILRSTLVAASFELKHLNTSQSCLLLTPHTWPIPYVFLFWNRFLRRETDVISADFSSDSVRPSSVRMASQVPTEVQRAAVALYGCFIEGNIIQQILVQTVFGLILHGVKGIVLWLD